MSPMLHHPALSSRNLQKGLTLVELLVSLAIGLVISLAAAVAYLGTRSTATAMANMANMNETGKLALDMVGRELQMAGFYPAIVASATSDTVLGSFTNGKNTSSPAYDQGLFGCVGALFDPTSRTCATTTAGAPDSIVINYFTRAELDTATSGSGLDCLRQTVATDPNNATAVAANRPLYVSNRFGVTSTTYSTPGTGLAARTITTRSLACNGNGKNPEDAIYQPIFEGVEDLTFSYGVHAGTGSLSPETYYTATEVTALATSGGLTGWQRVTAVRVCVLTRGTDNIRTNDVAGSLRTYANCRGGRSTYAIDDRTLFKRFERVFAVRNNLTGTY